MPLNINPNPGVLGQIKNNHKDSTLYQQFLNEAEAIRAQLAQGAADRKLLDKYAQRLEEMVQEAKASGVAGVTEDVVQNYKNALRKITSSSAIHGYDEYQTLMVELWGTYEQFIKLVHANQIMQTTNMALSLPAKGIGMAVDWVGDKTGVTHFMRRQLEKVGFRSATELPVINCQLKLNEDTNKFTRHVTVNGKALDDPQKLSLLDAALVAWLDSKGYKFDQQKQALLKNDNPPRALTQAEVQELEKSGPSDFTAFCQQETELALSASFARDVASEFQPPADEAAPAAPSPLPMVPRA